LKEKTKRLVRIKSCGKKISVLISWEAEYFLDGPFSWFASPSLRRLCWFFLCPLLSSLLLSSSAPKGWGKKKQKNEPERRG
jgi:hypothetical protein